MHHRLIVFLLPLSLLHGAGSLCDLNNDGQVNVVDVQLAISQSEGTTPCGSADLNLNGKCDAVDILRFINASLGQACAAAQVPAGDGSHVTAYGAKCDGSTDDRAALQAAFNDRAKWQNDTLIFPAGKTCMIGQGITLQNISGFTILGQGATIKAKNGMCTDAGASPGCTGFGPLVQIQDVDSFTIDNLDLDGNRANRVSAQRSGGHNYNIFKATNGTFRNIDSKNSTTDGLKIDATVKNDLRTRSQNISIIDSEFHNSYRNNVSVISGVNIRFLGTCTGTFTGTCTCQMTGANGQDPESGIDFEPDGNEASPAIDGALVDGCLVANNLGNGITTEGRAGARNISITNSIFYGNGGGGGPHNAAIRLTGINDRVYHNYVGVQKAVRWGVLYIQAGSNNIIENNFIDGVPPVGSNSGGRYVIYFGNFGDGSGEFKNNTITNIHTNASGNWCRQGAAGGRGSTVRGNTVNGVMQAPNPGCP